MEKVCVYIRAYNEERDIASVLKLLRSQITVGFELEILVLDSGSTDSTREIAHLLADKVVSIDKSQFSFPRSCNDAIYLTDAEYILFLSAHCYPVDSNLIASMLQRIHNGADAVFCRQIASVDSVNPLEDFILLKNFPASGSCNSYSNSCALYKRDALERVKFPYIPASEDRAWRLSAEREGLKIEYAPEVSVVHSHNDSAIRFAKRSWLGFSAYSDFTGRYYSPLLRALYCLANGAMAFMHYAVHMEPKNSFKSLQYAMVRSYIYYRGEII